MLVRRRGVQEIVVTYGCSAPRGRNDIGASIVSSQESSVRPGKVGSGEGSAVSTVVLLSESTALRCVFLLVYKSVCKRGRQHEFTTYSNRHVAVCVGLNSVDNRRESCGRRCVGTNSGGRVHVLEEGKRDRSDGDGSNLLPLVDGIIKLLSSSKSVQVPGLISICSIS